MPPVRCRDARQSERTGQGGDGGIDEAKIQILEAPVQLSDSRIPVPRQIDDEVIALDDPGIERPTAPGSEALAQEVVDLGYDRRRQDEPTLLLVDERPRPVVPVVAPVVVGVHDSGIEEDAHRFLVRVERTARAAPKPVVVRISSTRDAVSDRPLENAPAPGGPSRGSRVT